MTAEVKETQYQRKKRLAAEKAAREAASYNPFVAGTSTIPSDPVEEPINESLVANEAESEPGLQPNESKGIMQFAMPESEFDGDDWLDNVESTQVTAQVGDLGYVPISEEGVFSLNYKESNIVTVRPYPIMKDPHTSISVFNSISTLINDPSGEGDPIFNEISPRVAGGRDEVLQKMLTALKDNNTLRKATVRTIDNKFLLCQIISNKNNPETVGKFVLFRISYSMSKAFEEQGLYDQLSELVVPSSSRAIVINLTYDESRDRRLEYNVSLQTYAQGMDKLVQTASNAYVTVGTDMNAFKAWKAQFYAAFKNLKVTADNLVKYDLSKFTAAAAEEVWAKFEQRYNEINTTMATSAGTAAAAISQGHMPQMSTANPFGGATTPQSNPFGAKEPANPFVGNMEGKASNPFNTGGFSDM